MGIIMNDEMNRGMLSVKRRSDRIIWAKVALNGEMINIMSAYAPQTGCGENEKIKFWEEMDEELRDIPDTDKLWVGGDFNCQLVSIYSGDAAAPQPSPLVRAQMDILHPATEHEIQCIIAASPNKQCAYSTLRKNMQ